MESDRHRRPLPHTHNKSCNDWARHGPHSLLPSEDITWGLWTNMFPQGKDYPIVVHFVGYHWNKNKKWAIHDWWLSTWYEPTLPIFSREGTKVRGHPKKIDTNDDGSTNSRCHHMKNLNGVYHSQRLVSIKLTSVWKGFQNFAVIDDPLRFGALVHLESVRVNFKGTGSFCSKICCP